MECRRLADIIVNYHDFIFMSLKMCRQAADAPLENIHAA